MLINSVLGKLDTKDLGVTLMHEHMAALDRNMVFAYHDWYNREETLSIFAEVIGKIKEFEACTFVEASPINLNRDVLLLKDAAERAGINILCCTGLYWVEDPWYNSIEPEILAEYFIRDIEVGIQGTEIKAAFVKCCTDVLYGQSETNKAMIKATALASKKTGVPIYTHASSHARQGLYQQELLIQEGIEPHRIAIGHAFTSDDIEYVERIIKNGSYVGCDQVGYESFCTTEVIARNVIELCRKGYSKYIFLSHDKNIFSDFAFALSDARRNREENIICGSYDTVFRRLIPMLLEHGVTKEQITDMLVNNPRRYFEGETIK